MKKNDLYCIIRSSFPIHPKILIPWDILYDYFI